MFNTDNMPVLFREYPLPGQEDRSDIYFGFEVRSGDSIITYCNGNLQQLAERVVEGYIEQHMQIRLLRATTLPAPIVGSRRVRYPVDAVDLTYFVSKCKNLDPDGPADDPMKLYEKVEVVAFKIE